MAMASYPAGASEEKRQIGTTTDFVTTAPPQPPGWRGLRRGPRRSCIVSIPVISALLVSCRSSERNPRLGDLSRSFHYD
jgi:hypothetical protein